jgi:hypothetical protein
VQRSIRRKLIELNLALYGRFAGEFSSSRAVLQPGIVRALATLGSFSSLVDLGCGDARVGRALLGGQVGLTVQGWRGYYLGVDASRELLALAPSQTESFQLLPVDLSQEDWIEHIPRPEGGFEALVLFSVLHHIPGKVQRLHFLRECSTLLLEGGRWALSVWQFLHQERFRDRLVPWSSIKVREDEVESGDVLQDWRRGGRGLRYVHSFGLEELHELCEKAGLQVEEHFRSDGESGDLGLYLLGKK